MTTQRDHNDPDLDLAELVTAEQTHRLRQWWRWVLGRDSDQPAEDVWEPTTHHTADNYPDDVGEVVRREPPVRQRWLDKWGWYEDRPAGAWSTTRQAEALNLATTRQPVQHAGLLAGRNLMGQAAVRLDPFELYRDRVIDGVNVCAIGDIGSSKSSLLKTLGLYRQLILNRQIVFFDKKLQGDRGEYGVIADELGVESVTFRAGGGGVSLNLLDPAISTDGRHAGGVPGVVPAGQETLLLAVLRDAMERALSPREKAAVRVALGIVNERAANAGTEPLLKDVARQLIDGYGGQSERAFEQVRLGEDLPESVKADLGDFAYFGPRWASR